MAIQHHRPAWISRGWMSFTVANGGLLELGGASQTVPTSALSVSSFLTNGIPQSGDKTRFADKARDGEAGAHSIKHALIEIVSAGATTPAGRSTQDGSTPTTSLGRQRSIGDILEYHNCRDEIFNFKLFNRSGSNMVVEVEVFE